MGAAFCAGADLLFRRIHLRCRRARRRQEDPLFRRCRARWRRRVTLRIFKLLEACGIAAINGPAVGIGATMTLPMDIRLASDNARIGFVFSRRGIVPEAASSFFLPRIVGISQALQWCFSRPGVRCAGSAARRVGQRCAIRRPADGGGSDDRAEIADNTAPLSVALIRQMMWRAAQA